MALYVIRARESGQYLEHSGAYFSPSLSPLTLTFTDDANARGAAAALPFACDVLELRPVYRDEAAQ